MTESIKPDKFHLLESLLLPPPSIHFPSSLLLVLGLILGARLPGMTSSLSHGEPGSLHGQA